LRTLSNFHLNFGECVHSGAILPKDEKIRVCFSKREKREEFFPKSGGNRGKP
jgi:hypothetical protein